jgi:hypothetical protein
MCIVYLTRALIYIEHIQHVHTCLCIYVCKFNMHHLQADSRILVDGSSMASVGTHCIYKICVKIIVTILSQIALNAVSAGTTAHTQWHGFEVLREDIKEDSKQSRRKDEKIDRV